ncbi:MAG: hypothetical protein FWH36_03525 [Lentimicrobiaceae bacterium]|nr:hypothetical protein [Lentimicrobiaceae bacterium]
MKKIVFCCLLFGGLSLSAQEFSGYVSGMPSVIVQQPEGDVWWQTLVHNRLNFGKQINKFVRVDVGMRNRIITGSEVMLDPQSISSDAGWVRLSWNWREGKRAVGNTSLDRLYLTFEKNKWKFQAGRQRINWGQTFVWNANDIFNTYSFFDFDYPERSGCDALRLTYYYSETASAEWAASINYEEKITAAYLHRWNWKTIDFQVLAGELSESDLVIGGAITGDIKGLNIRTEASYFHPVKNLADTSGIAAVSLGLDYIFSNSLMFQVGGLYSNVGKDATVGGLVGLYAAPISAKYLSICQWNLFTQISYPLTPRLNGSLSGMYFIDIKSCYGGISLDYSIIENLDLSFVAQYFYLNGGKAAPENMHVLWGFARIKYSF